MKFKEYVEGQFSKGNQFKKDFLYYGATIPIVSGSAMAYYGFQNISQHYWTLLLTLPHFYVSAGHWWALKLRSDRLRHLIAPNKGLVIDADEFRKQIPDYKKRNEIPWGMGGEWTRECAQFINCLDDRDESIASKLAEKHGIKDGGIQRLFHNLVERKEYCVDYDRWTRNANIAASPGSGKTVALTWLSYLLINWGDNIIIQIQPKGDENERDTVCHEAIAAGRGDDLAFISLSHPEVSEHFQLLSEYHSLSAKATEITALMEGGGESDIFAKFGWKIIKDVMTCCKYLRMPLNLKTIAVYSGPRYIEMFLMVMKRASLLGVKKGLINESHRERLINGLEGALSNRDEFGKLCQRIMHSEEWLAKLPLVYSVKHDHLVQVRVLKKVMEHIGQKAKETVNSTECNELFNEYYTVRANIRKLEKSADPREGREFIDRFKGYLEYIDIDARDVIAGDENVAYLLDSMIPDIIKSAEHFEKLVASLRPLFSTLTTENAGQILCSNEPGSFSWHRVFKEKKIVYIELNNLIDETVASAFFALLVNGFLSYIGHIYGNIRPEDFPPCWFLVDELNAVVTDEVVEAAERVRAANVRFVSTQQSQAGIEARTSRAQKERLQESLNMSGYMRLEDTTTAERLERMSGRVKLYDRNKSVTENAGLPNLVTRILSTPKRTDWSSNEKPLVEASWCGKLDKGEIWWYDEKPYALKLPYLKYNGERTSMYEYMGVGYKKI